MIPLLESPRNDADVTSRVLFLAIILTVQMLHLLYADVFCALRVTLALVS